MGKGLLGFNKTDELLKSIPQRMFYGGKMETGPEAKQRLIFETAAKGQLGLKLCARHYYAHAEGSGECIIRTAEQLGEVLEELDEEFNNFDNLLDELEEINEVES